MMANNHDEEDNRSERTIEDERKFLYVVG